MNDFARLKHLVTYESCDDTRAALAVDTETGTQVICDDFDTVDENREGAYRQLMTKLNEGLKLSKTSEA